MAHTTGRCRSTCVHEAGHAFVRWYFGFETDRAVVLTGKEIRAGKRVRGRDGYLVACQGMVSGPAILDWRCWHAAGTRISKAKPAGNRWVNYRRDVELILLSAGFHAHAHHARIHPNAAALSGGCSDLDRYDAIKKAWSLKRGDGEYEALEERIAAWTRALVRSHRGARAIRAIADALMVNGRLSGNRIAALCRQAYDDRECPVEAWATCWPPTVEQLRAGFIPEHPEKAAA